MGIDSAAFEHSCFDQGHSVPSIRPGSRLSIRHELTERGEINLVVSGSQISSQDAMHQLSTLNDTVCHKINLFTQSMLRTRGNWRIGSGMGFLMEALWGFSMNEALREAEAGGNGVAAGCDIALLDHKYNDFACVRRHATWDPLTQGGELLRIEAKAMNVGGDEPKGHFDQPIDQIGDWDLLLVVIWAWEPVGQNDPGQYYPRILEAFLDRARTIATLRDRLHIARGGTFVDRNACPDGCIPEMCPHHGEALNSRGSRERIEGPLTRKPKGSSAAQNFGGLVRMIATRGAPARHALDEVMRDDPVATEYVNFIRRHRVRATRDG